jgi:nudix-type nucleoside diphosphatase (YffH/AdpP family)
VNDEPRVNVQPSPAAGVPGVDVPDRRGRTGLERAGRELDGNPRVRVRDVRVLASNWYVTRTTTFDYQRADGTWEVQERETYDRGDGACLFLYEPEARTVLLVRQFRYPAYVNGHPDGMLIELPAGLLDEDAPEEAIRREVQEEVGLAVGAVEPVFQVYMSPGSVTERLHFFAAPYRRGDVVHGARGGLADEGEDVEVLELAFDDAVARIGADVVDAKTIMMLQWAATRGPFAG